MYQLGISAYYHDSAACLLRDGQIVAAAQEERFSRVKHDPSFPLHAIRFCLDHAQLDFEQLDEIIFYDKPFIKFERILETFYAIAPRGWLAFVKHIPGWISEKVFFKRLLKQGLTEVDRGKVDVQKLRFSEHHLSHAAWAYYTSPFQESAILTIDGVGEWTTTSIFKASGNTLEVLKEQHFPHSLGLLYSSFTQFLGFKVNDGEYKMMGLAPYGNVGSADYTRYKSGIEQEMVEVYADGSLRLNLKFFQFLAGKRMIHAQRWQQLFDLAPRDEKQDLNQQHCDFALAAQHVTEEIILRLANETAKVTGSKHLCLSGGVAYNCVANGRLLKSNIFDQVFVPPAVGDSGGAGGAALAAYYLEREGERDKSLFIKNRISFLGPDYHRDFVIRFLESQGIPYQVQGDFSATCRRAAELLKEGAIIGWMQGRMEFGARALGARSIIADPKVEDIQRKVNLKIKFRESFRPFAPVMLEEDAAQYFDLEVPSPYMALVADIKDQFKLELPADFADWEIIEKSRQPKSQYPGITHVDYSSRIQTVDQDTNPYFRPLLEAFKELTGSSLLINTSFNVKDEPIVCSPQDALRCFMKTDMDYLFLGNCLVSKSDVDVSN